MNLITGLFRSARKRLMTTDNDLGAFRDKLTQLVDQKDSLDEAAIGSAIEELKGFTNDLPESEDKSKLIRFLEDFKAVKEQDGAVAAEAANAVCDLFEKLDTEAMQDTPIEGAAEESAEPVETEVVEGEEITTDPEPTEVEAEEVVSETDAPDSDEIGDADPNSEYTLEEIYRFIKKRMAEDSGEEVPEEEGLEELDAEEEVGDEECAEEDEEEVVTDHAPHIPVTVNDHAAKGSLRALFDLAKRGN